MVSREPAADVAVGMTWLGAAAVRVATLRVDRPPVTASHWVYLGLEVACGTASPVLPLRLGNAMNLCRRAASSGVRFMPAGGCLALPELRGIRCGEYLVVAYDLAVGSSLIVRPARAQDVRQMARVHVRCWQETYRGLMPDAVLDDPGFLVARERMWTAVLTSERYRQNRVAVAERDDELAGIAMSGPPEDVTAGWTRQLYVLYVYAADHGTGAGRTLLEAVIDFAEPAALWVADPNPRAQAFYRKHGFAADGTARFEDGVREIRMVRGVRHGEAGRSHHV
jgi:GNAT superfamily N-acetyltransferase